jgi:exopolysaccharide production protein ExoQ
MELTDAAGSSRLMRQPLNSISLPFIGFLISALLIGCGLLFRTYSISMSSTSWEAARQLGLPFVFAEVLVIIFAVRNGLKFGEFWRNLPVIPRYSFICFIALYWIGAAFFSEAGLVAQAQNAITLFHLLFGLAVYHAVAPITSSGMRQMAKWLTIGLMIFCGMTTLAFVFHPPFSSMPGNEITWQFIIPGFISVRLFGAFCGAIFSFLILQLLIDEEQDNDAVYQYAWLTLSAGMMIWSGTRAAIIGTVVSLSLIAIVYKLRPKVKTLILIFCSIAIAAFLAMLLIPHGDGAFMLVAAGDGESADSVSGGRLSYWTAIWKAYQNVPFFGAGPFASFWMLPAGEQIHVQPHNIILQFLITWGAFATIPALLMLGYATWQAHIITLKNRITLPFLAMLDCLLVMSLFDGMMHFAQHLMLLMISFGIIFSVTKVPTHWEAC